MTKPNEFIMNTDYLALAQKSSKEFTAYFTSETIQGGAQIERTRDFNITATQGAIDRILISRNGNPFTVGNSMVFSLDSGLVVSLVTIWVYRPNPSTIRVRLRCATSQTKTIPAQTITVKVASFEPPNLF